MLRQRGRWRWRLLLRPLATLGLDLGFRFRQAGIDLRLACRPLFRGELGGGKLAGTFVKRILAYVRDARILTGQFLPGFGAVFASLLFARKPAMQALDPLEFRTQRLGIGESAAIRT